MARHFSVKPSLAGIAGALVLSTQVASLHADEPPDPHELLRRARRALGAQDWKFNGHLRLGRAEHPFRLDVGPNPLRYQFLDNGDVLTLRVGEKSSALEESRGGKTTTVAAARLAQAVHDTDIHYEDLARPFLYWENARVIGSDIIWGHSCWKVEVRPPARNDTDYGRVVLSLGKEDGAQMKTECFDANNQWRRRLTVITVMKREGAWLLKTIRIESSDGRKSDPQPTYLTLDDIVRDGQR